MKKIFLSLCFIAVSMIGFSQGVILHDTVQVTITKDGAAVALNDTIFNPSTTDSLSVTWSKTDNLSSLTGWSGTQVCDPQQCYSYGMINTNVYHPKIAPGKNGVFIVDVKALPTAVNGTAFVTIAVTAGTTVGNMVFRYDAIPTAVKDYENNNIVSLYPNPATNFINITLNERKISTIHVLNVIGRRIASFNVDANKSNQLRVPLDNVADGIYLLQFADNSGKVLGVRRVTKQ